MTKRGEYGQHGRRGAATRDGAERRPIASNGAGAQSASGARASSRRARRRWRVVFWVALAVFVAAALAIGVILFSYWQGSSAYRDLADDVVDVSSAEGDRALSDLSVDWDALLAINPDTIGWIYLPGTAVNYPVVYSGDDVRYLHTDFYGNENWVVSHGSIFLSGINDPTLADANNILYGHHMNDGSMFAALASLTDDESFNAHRTAYFLTPNGNIRLESFALVHVPATSDLAQATFATSADQTAYVDRVRGESIVSPDGEVPSSDDITRTFMLSTCDNVSSGRYILFCYVVESDNPNVEAVGASARQTDDGAIVDVDPADAEAIAQAQGGY